MPHLCSRLTPHSRTSPLCSSRSAQSSPEHALLFLPLLSPHSVRVERQRSVTSDAPTVVGKALRYGRMQRGKLQNMLLVSADIASAGERLRLASRDRPVRMRRAAMLQSTHCVAFSARQQRRQGSLPRPYVWAKQLLLRVDSICSHGPKNRLNPTKQSKPSSQKSPGLRVLSLRSHKVSHFAANGTTNDLLTRPRSRLSLGASHYKLRALTELLLILHPASAFLSSVSRCHGGPALLKSPPLLLAIALPHSQSSQPREIEAAFSPLHRGREA